MSRLLDPPPDARDPSPPAWLAGRALEWSRVASRLDAALDGAGGLVVVSGGAGIGKTTLVNALAAAARQQGFVVLAGGCYDLATTPPYGPWSEALASHSLGDDHAIPPLAIRDFSTVSGITSQELYEHIRSWLVDAAGRQPICVILEDLHWADTASLDLLRVVGRRLADQPILIVVTWREDEATSHPLDRVLLTLIRETQPLRISLQRLDLAGMRDLIASRYDLLDDDLATLSVWVQRHAEGNPFFAGEMLLTLEQSGALHTDAHVWHFDPPADFSVPPLVRHAIEQRLGLFGKTTLRLLEYAAIIGQEMPLSLLQAASGVADDDLGAALQEAIGGHVVSEGLAIGTTLRFQHSLVREALYQRQPVLRRRARHLRVAECWLDEPAPDPLSVGHHFQAADDPRAVEWLVRAGEQSLALYSPHDAIAHLTRAGALAVRFGGELPYDALRARARAWEMVGDYGRAREDYEQVLSLARREDDRRGEWQALLDLGFLWTERDYGRAGDALRQALALARESLDDTEVAQSLNAVGNWHVNHDEPRRALSYHQDALAIFEQHGDQRGIAATLDLLAMAQYLAGDVRAAARQYERAVERLEALDDRQVLVSALTNWASAGGYFETDAAATAAGQTEHWLDLHSRARSIAREINWAAGQAYAEIQAGAFLAPRGEMGEALALAEAGMALAERIGHRQWMICGHVVLGRMHADLLDIAPAREHLEAALSLARAIDSPVWMALTAAALGSLLVQSGELDAAGTVLESVLPGDAPVVSNSQRRCRLAWAQLQLARGDPERSLHVIDELIVAAPSADGIRDVPWLAFERGRARAALCQAAEAQADFEAARDGALDLGYRHLLWRIDLARGRLSHATGHAADARAAFERALAIANEIASTLPSEPSRVAFLSRVREQTPAVDSSVPDRRTPGGLSPRETEVLQLVAEGLTDAEIGERLSISYRTVGRHLGTIYNKLGVGSRTAAIVFAFEHGLLERSTSG